MATTNPYVYPALGSSFDDYWDSKEQYAYDNTPTYQAWAGANTATPWDLVSGGGLQVSGDPTGTQDPRLAAAAEWYRNLSPEQSAEYKRLTEEHNQRERSSFNKGALLTMGGMAGLGLLGPSLFAGLGSGAGAAGGAAGAAGAAGGVPAWLSNLGGSLGKSFVSSQLMKAISGGGAGGGQPGGPGGAQRTQGGGMANPFTDWLSSFGKVNPLQALFQNYQMQGAQRDVNNAGGKANEYADYLMKQVGRTTNTSQQLSDALTAALRPGAAGGPSAQQNKILAAILGGNNGRGGIDALNALGAKREQWNAEDRDALNKSMSGISERLGELYKSLGPAKMYGESDVDKLSSDIYNKKSGAVDRALALASSQGFADSITRGLSDSSQAADTRDNVVRRFADTYSSLDADSRAQATDQVNRLSGLQTSQREAAISQLLSTLNPELQARVATYRPDNTAVTAAQAEANFGQADLGRLASLRAALAGEDNARTSTNNARTAALIAGLNTSNQTGVRAASDLASASSSAYAEALKGLGGTRSNLANTLAPVGQAASSALMGAIPALISSLPPAMSGVGATLSKWLSGGNQTVTPEVQAAIEQAMNGGYDWSGGGFGGGYDFGGGWGGSGGYDWGGGWGGGPAGGEFDWAGNPAGAGGFNWDQAFSDWFGG